MWRRAGTTRLSHYDATNVSVGLAWTAGTPGPGAFRHHRLLLHAQPALAQAELLAGIHHIPAVDRYLASGPCTTMAVRRR